VLGLEKKYMNKKILQLARSEIIKFKPYNSGVNEIYADKIYLHFNENAYALPGYENFNRYPEGMRSEKLLQKLSAIYNVALDKLIAVRGADEAIDLLIRTFCSAYKDKIMICPPTYSMYEIFANIQSADVVKVPLLADNNFDLDINQIMKYWNPEIKLIFLCFPNNPTGTLLKPKIVLELCQKLANKALIIVDEAYIEFSDASSFINFIDEYPNLVVLRTLSKFYGLAGIRCGAAITNPEVIALLQKVLPPCALSTPIIDIVCQYLTPNNLSKLKSNRDLILQDREKLYQFLSTSSFVKKVWQSHANFLLIEVDDIVKIINLCKKNNIIIRNINDGYGLKNCIRISIGTVQENQFLMEILANG
jgi:histidinol-phosphate aminotransferase